MEEVKCKCGATLGWIQVINGVRFFTYGSGAVPLLKVFCKECGTEFYWETNQKELKKAMLTAFFLKEREKCVEKRE